MFAERFQSTLPVWGATEPAFRHIPASQYFNPRSPCGERPPLPFHLCIQHSFQSTLPVWGATRQVALKHNVARISIHAPRVGGDAQAILDYIDKTYDFNPRSPCGERHRYLLRMSASIAFQSTLPVWGATLIVWPLNQHWEISIHAPRGGSDSFPVARFQPEEHFNPRSPCGERPYTSSGFTASARFQSTLPVWGATYTGGSFSASSIISIHAPRVGSDMTRMRLSALAGISIHAPRVGSDSKTAQILLEILSHLNSFAPSEKKKIPFHRKEQGKFIEIF